LLRPRTESAHGTDRTTRRPRDAGPAAVGLNQVRGPRPRRLRQHLGQLIVDHVGIIGPGQAETLAHAEDMGVHGDRRYVKGVTKQHIGGLEADAGQRSERGAIAWNFASMLSAQGVGHPDDGTRLGAIEAGRADLRLEGGWRQPRPVGRGAVLLEEIRRHLVHTLVRALGRENRRDQKLEWIAEVERDLRVGIGALEEPDDFSRSRFPFGQCLALHDPPICKPLGAISMRAASTGNGSRAAMPREGSTTFITQPTSGDGTGTPPNRTRSAASANGRSAAGTKRTRALMSGPSSSIFTLANPRSNATRIRPRSLPAARNA